MYNVKYGNNVNLINSRHALSSFMNESTKILYIELYKRCMSHYYYSYFILFRVGFNFSL